MPRKTAPPAQTVNLKTIDMEAEANSASTDQVQWPTHLNDADIATLKTMTDHQLRLRIQKGEALKTLTGAATNLNDEHKQAIATYLDNQIGQINDILKQRHNH